MRSATRSAAPAHRLAAQASAATSRASPRIAVEFTPAATSFLLEQKLSLKGAWCVDLTRKGGKLREVGPLASERRPGFAGLLRGSDVLQEKRVQHALREGLRRGAGFLGLRGDRRGKRLEARLADHSPGRHDGPSVRRSRSELHRRAGRSRL